MDSNDIDEINDFAISRAMIATIRDDYNGNSSEFCGDFAATVVELHDTAVAAVDALNSNDIDEVFKCLTWIIEELARMQY